MVPEIPIVLCTNCNHFFHEEDFEFASLQKKECPFCKVRLHFTVVLSCFRAFVLSCWSGLFSPLLLLSLVILTAFADGLAFTFYCTCAQLEVNEEFGKPVALQKVKSAVQSVMAQRQRQNNMVGAVADAARR